MFCIRLDTLHPFIMLTDFVLIAILHAFGHMCNINKQVERNIQPSRKEYKAASVISTLIHHEFCRGLHAVFTHGLTLSFSALGSWLGKLHNKSGLNVSDICFLTSSLSGKGIENTAGFIFIKTKSLLFQRKKGK